MKRNKGELVGLYTHIFPDTNGYKVDRMNKKQLVDKIDAHIHSSIRLGDTETKWSGSICQLQNNLNIVMM